MVSTVSAKTLTTVIGAMSGGMISDDDGFGTILGLATGAAVGYNFTVIKPRISDIYTHNSTLNIERPMTDLERLREKMLRRVDRMDIVDTTDEEDVLSKEKLRNEINSKKDFESLKELQYTYKNGGKEFEALEELGSAIAKQSGYDRVNIISKDLREVSNKVGALVNAYTNLGFSEEEAAEKADLFKDLLKEHEYFSLDSQTNKMKIGTTEFNLTGRFNDSLSYVDGKNFYSVKTANIFGKQLAEAKFTKGGDNKLNIANIMDSLGISQDHTAARNYITSNIDNWMINGMLPEELTALTMLSPNLNITKDELEELTSSLKNHAMHESGMIKDGYSQKEVANASTFEVRRTGQMAVLDKTLDLESGKFVSINSRNTVDKPSELVRARTNIKIASGRDYLDADKKPDDYTAYNRVNSRLNNANAMTDGARYSSISSARETPIRLANPETADMLSLTMEQLKAEGKLPEGYETARVLGRKSVKEESFNYSMQSIVDKAEKQWNDYLARVENQKSNPNIKTKTAKPYLKVNGRSFELNENLIEDLKLSVLADGAGLISQEGASQYTHDLVRYRELGKVNGSFKVTEKLAKFDKLRELTGINENTTELDLSRLKGINTQTSRAKTSFEKMARRSGLTIDFDQIARLAIQDTTSNGISSNLSVGHLLQSGILSSHDSNIIFNDSKLNGQLFSLLEGLNRTHKQSLNEISKIDNVIREITLDNPNANVDHLLELRESLATAVPSGGNINTRLAKQHNDLIKLKINPNELLGYDAEGEIRAPKDISGDMYLTRLITSEDARGRESLSLRFEGTSNLGEKHTTIKDFGDNAKANNRVLGEDAIEISNIVSKQGNQFGEDRPIRNLVDSKQLKGNSLKSSATKNKVDVVSDIGTADQKIATSFTNHFINDKEKIIELDRTGADLEEFKKLFTSTNPINANFELHDDIFKPIHNRALSILREYDSVEKQLIGELGSTETIPVSVANQLLTAKETAEAKLWSVGQLVNALGDTKGSGSAATGMFISAQSKLNKYKDIISSDIDSTEARDAVKLMMNFSGEDLHVSLPNGSTQKIDIKDLDNVDLKTLNLNNFFERVDNKLYQSYEAFNSDNITKSMLSGKFFDDFMFNSFELAYDEAGYDLMLSSPDYHPTFKTGSGNKVGFSHFAQTQLANQGFDANILSMFGKQDEKMLYELQAMSHSTYYSSNHVVPKNANVIDEKNTLNYMFKELLGNDERRITNFLNAIEGSDPEKLDDFVKTFISRNATKEKPLEMFKGIMDSPYLYYALESNINTGGHNSEINIIPISKRNTAMSGYTRVGNGDVTSSHLDRLQFNIIRNDLRAMSSVNDIIDDKNAKALTESLDELFDVYMKPFGSLNNPKLKAIATRFGENSANLKFEVSNNAAFLDRVEKAKDEGRETKGISKKRAFNILREQGHDVKELDDVNAFIKNGILQIDRNHSTAMPSIVGREPAQGPFSFVATELFVLDEKGLNENSIYGKSMEEYDKYFKFADQDNDHLMLFATENKMSLEEAEKVWGVATKQTQYKKEAIILAKSLAVKSGTETEDITDAAYSVFQARDDVLANKDRYGLVDNDIINNTDNYVNAINKRVYQRAEEGINKRALRKLVSPGVTIFSMDMQKNVTNLLSKEFGQNMIEGDVQSVLTSATELSHYLTENMIKATHTKTTSTSISSIESLLDYRNDFLIKKPGAENKYLESLEAMLRDSAKKLLNNSEDKAAIAKKNLEEAIKVMVESERSILKLSDGQIETILDANREARAILREHATLRGAGKTVGETQLKERSFKGFISDTLNILSGHTESGTPALVEVMEATRSQTPSLKLSSRVAKNMVSENIRANSTPLMIGAGVLALGALMTQKDPNFAPSQSMRPEPMNMTLAPQVATADESGMFDALQAPSSGFILPEADISRYTNQAMEIYGQGRDTGQQMTNSINQAIFGNNLQDVRIENVQ